MNNWALNYISVSSSENSSSFEVSKSFKSTLRNLTASLAKHWKVMEICFVPASPVPLIFPRL